MTTINCSQCLICLQKTEASKNTSESIEQRQLSVIYLVNKLLKIPSEVCCDFLSAFGNPEEWISICSDCCSLVDEGRQLFNQIQRLELKHNSIAEKLRRKMKVKVKIEPGQSQESVILGKATTEIRNYLDMWYDIEDDEDIGRPETEEDLGNLLDFEQKMEIPEVENVEIIKVEECNTTSMINNNEAYFEPEETIDIFQAFADYQNHSQPSQIPEFEEEKVEFNSEVIEGLDPLAPDENSDQDHKAQNQNNLVRKSIYRVYKRCNDIPSPSIDSSLPEGENCICEECGGQFTDLQNLEIHMRAFHLDPGALQCQGCLKDFTYITSYSIHFFDILKTHPSRSCALKAFRCDMGQCSGIVRSSQQALALHQKIYHENQASTLFKCPVCHIQFSNKSNFKVHMSRCHR